MTLDQNGIYKINGAALLAVVTLARKGALWEHATQIEGYIAQAEPLAVIEGTPDDNSVSGDTEANTNG